jgi:hypothetical protein
MAVKVALALAAAVVAAQAAEVVVFGDSWGSFARTCCAEARRCTATTMLTGVFVFFFFPLALFCRGAVPAHVHQPRLQY